MNILSGNRSARRAVVQLAWPLASVMLGETLMGLVDTKLVGGLGAAVLGGVGLANAALYLTNISMLGLMRGVKVCTAHAVGRGLPHHGRRYAEVGLVLGLGVGTLFGYLLTQAHILLGLMNVSAELIGPAQDYLTARAWGLPATCALAALMEHRQGMGEVRSSLAVGLGGNAVNAVLAFGLIYGRFGMPELGVYGAGLGTTLTEVLQLGAMLAVVGRALWRERRSHIAVTMALNFRTAIREVSTLGVPTALHFGFEYMAFAVCTGILASLSQADVAAHQIAVVVNRLAYLPGLAVGEVACILVSGALGAQRVNEAEQSVQAALSCALAFMMACGVGLALFGTALAAMFTTDPHIVALTAKVLLICGLFQMVDAVNIVMRGALRGARDVRGAAIIGIIILWTTVPVVTYGLGKMAGWGVVGGWVSFFTQSALCAAVYTYRWKRGKWRAQFTPAVPAMRGLQVSGVAAPSLP